MLTVTVLLNAGPISTAAAGLRALNPALPNVCALCETSIAEFGGGSFTCLCYRSYLTEEESNEFWTNRSANDSLRSRVCIFIFGSVVVVHNVPFR